MTTEEKKLSPKKIEMTVNEEDGLELINRPDIEKMFLRAAEGLFMI